MGENIFKFVIFFRKYAQSLKPVQNLNSFIKFGETFGKLNN